ncbi:hypothetical protein A3860_27710 [Niastella vici]|uniref:Lipocalin-like domain-containing protein n=1 Tax=Niastella vici TaxID=1703345 RepID=A0A1V9FVW1_9BACT|nr:hypothetical protein [Niastella vici]OQP62483.1 hypothetical protein A3860_27710 [Niastella vici]
MQKKQSMLLGLMACFLITSFIACKKDAKDDTDTQPAQDNSLAESNYNDANTMVDASVAAGTSFTFRQATNQDVARLEGILGTCATVTIDTVSTTRSVTINFGTSNCLCADNRYRRGKILATWTGKYRESGTVVTITYDGYYVNDNQIKGTHTTTNMGLNAAQHLVYKIEVNGSIVKANNGGTITWVSTRYREWVAGSSTPLNLLDDTYSITGSASGTNAANEAYTINITQALVRNMSCYWFESGKVEVTPAGKLTRTLDYGSTGCDNKATVTIGNTTFNVTLQ